MLDVMIAEIKEIGEQFGLDLTHKIDTTDSSSKIKTIRGLIAGIHSQYNKIKTIRDLIAGTHNHSDSSLNDKCNFSLKSLKQTLHDLQSFIHSLEHPKNILIQACYLAEYETAWFTMQHSAFSKISTEDFSKACINASRPGFKIFGLLVKDSRFSKISTEAFGSVLTKAFKSKLPEARALMKDTRYKKLPSQTLRKIYKQAEPDIKKLIKRDPRYNADFEKEN
jgi:hypothetical protein